MGNSITGKMVAMTVGVKARGAAAAARGGGGRVKAAQHFSLRQAGDPGVSGGAPRSHASSGVKVSVCI